MSDNNNKSSLQERIAKAKESSTIAPSPKSSANSGNNGTSKGMSTGMRIGMEFCLSIVISVFIGLWLDKIFETKPFFFIALFFLGVITAFVNVWRITNGVGSAVGYKNLHQDDTDKEQDNSEENK